MRTKIPFEIVCYTKNESSLEYCKQTKIISFRGMFRRIFFLEKVSIFCLGTLYSYDIEYTSTFFHFKNLYPSKFFIYSNILLKILLSATNRSSLFEWSSEINNERNVLEDIKQMYCYWITNRNNVIEASLHHGYIHNRQNLIPLHRLQRMLCCVYVYDDMKTKPLVIDWYSNGVCIQNIV